MAYLGAAFFGPAYYGPAYFSSSSEGVTLVTGTATETDIPGYAYRILVDPVQVTVTFGDVRLLYGTEAWTPAAQAGGPWTPVSPGSGAWTRQ